MNPTDSMNQILLALDPFKPGGILPCDKHMREIHLSMEQYRKLTDAYIAAKFIGDASTRKDEVSSATIAPEVSATEPEHSPSEISVIKELREGIDNILHIDYKSIATQVQDILEFVNPYLCIQSRWRPMTEHPPEMEPVIAKTKHGTVGIAYVYKLENEHPQWNFMAMGQNAMGLWDKEAVWMSLPS